MTKSETERFLSIHSIAGGSPASSLRFGSEESTARSRIPSGCAEASYVIVTLPSRTVTEAIPAYLCILGIPLFYSISEGIAIGVISYVVLNLFCGKAKKVHTLMYILAVLFVLKFFFL